jgi:hypothetical protein
MSLHNRIKLLESQIACRRPPVEERALTQEELDSWFEDYLIAREHPDFQRVEWMDDYCRSSGWEDIDDLRRDKEWWADVEARFPDPNRRWAHARKPSGMRTTWPTDRPLPKGWRYDQASV